MQNMGEPLEYGTGGDRLRGNGLGSVAVGPARSGRALDRGSVAGSVVTVRMGLEPSPGRFHHGTEISVAGPPAHFTLDATRVGSEFGHIARSARAEDRRYTSVRLPLRPIGAPPAR